MSVKRRQKSQSKNKKVIKSKGTAALILIYLQIRQVLTYLFKMSRVCVPRASCETPFLSDGAAFGKAICPYVFNLVLCDVNTLPELDWKVVSTINKRYTGLYLCHQW